MSEPKVYTIRVTNLTDERVDIHKDLLIEEVDYIKSCPTLSVEIVEINVKRQRYSR